MTYTGEILTKILVLPYVGKELNMIIMLPDENFGLEMVENELHLFEIHRWTKPDMQDEERCKGPSLDLSWRRIMT